MSAFASRAEEQVRAALAAAQPERGDLAGAAGKKRAMERNSVVRVRVWMSEHARAALEKGEG